MFVYSLEMVCATYWTHRALHRIIALIYHVTNYIVLHCERIPYLSHNNLRGTNVLVLMLHIYLYVHFFTNFLK